MATAEPPARKVSFNLGAIAAPPSHEAAGEQRVPLITHALDVQALGTYAQSLPLEQLPDTLRFGEMGGCPPLFRACWVRVSRKSTRLSMRSNTNMRPPPSHRPRS
jgi:hypothetical protein|tara:strand:+ start:131 stop:445 length:315 start_codon:yes stop_codon:yes gene_type:complete